MRQLRSLSPYLRKYRSRLVWGFIVAALGAVFTTVPPYLLRVIVDDLQQRGIDTWRLIEFSLFILGAAVLAGIFNFYQRQLIQGVSYRIEYALRIDLFKRFMQMDQAFFGENHTGDLMARATNDLSAVRQMLGPGLQSIAASGLQFVVSAIWMFTIDVKLALITLLLLPMISATFVVIGQRMRARFLRVQEEFGHISTNAQENFSGIRTIKAYAQEEAEIGSFLDLNHQYQSLNLRYVLLSGLMWPLTSLLMGTISALVLLVGGQAVASGRISLGEFVQFTSYLALLGWPMIALGWTVTLYQQGQASMQRIAEIISRIPGIRTADNAAPIGNVTGDVRYDDVGVRYGDRWIVRHVSFHIPVGTSLAIVGATGAGKTTLINLLGRVQDPSEGRVLIDDHDIKAVPLDALRASIGYVPQDTFLFSLPLKDNVQFGREDVTQAEFEDALLVSQLVNDLPQFPQGMDTLLGERGVTLSGGQKQRTAIARAILRDSAILVLDDALSSVDTNTAAEILGHLRRVMKGRTTIIIAQRIATVKDADQIVVLDNGTIVESGKHAELVKRDGYYAAMYRRELLRQELGESQEQGVQTRL